MGRSRRAEDARGHQSGQRRGVREDLARLQGRRRQGVAAARRAFETFSQTTKEERLAILQSIMAEYQKRYDEIAAAICEEMGAPMWLSKAAQAATGMGHLAEIVKILKEYEFENAKGKNAIRKEPVGCAASSRRGTGRSTRSSARCAGARAAAPWHA
jgi:hypothetical protein